MSSTGRELRALFAVILVHGRLDDALALRDEFEPNFMDDFRDVSQDLKTALALRDIDRHLRANVKELSLAAFPTMPQLAEYRELLARLGQEHRNRWIAMECSYDRDELQHTLRGGSGKSCLSNLLLAQTRWDGKIGLAVASSELASLILQGGTTAHYRFKLPLSTEPETTCRVPWDSELADLLWATDWIVWDECSMIHKYSIEAASRLFIDVTESPDLFGGKDVVFSGDFKQILPVVPEGTQSQIVHASPRQMASRSVCRRGDSRQTCA